MSTTTRQWVVVGPYDAATGYAENRHWLDDPPIVVTGADGLRAVDPVTITGILLCDPNELSAETRQAIDEEIETLQALWPVGVTTVYS